MSARTMYLADYAITPREKIRKAVILCDDDRILAIGSRSAFNLDSTADSDIMVRDLDGTYAVPGFVDIHIHGAAGFDSAAPKETRDKFPAMCAALAAHGVTTFVPTIVSMRPGELASAVSELSTLFDTPCKGAEPVAIHVEGPFLNREKHGSQLCGNIREVDLGETREILAAGGGRVKIMTLAPECPGSDGLILTLLENHVIASMGHSLADEAQALRAVDVGANHCTHIFNGMGILHHREVGLAAVALTDDRVTAEIILDGFHIHPRIVELTCRVKPKDRIVGISDSLSATGLGDGVYHIGGSDIDVRDGHATTRDGIIAGTTLTLELGWRKLLEYAKMSVMESATCMTLNPCVSLGLSDRGELLPGRLADIAFFDAKTDRVAATVKRGQFVYLSPSMQAKGYAVP